jgi:hypothetical protein
MAMLLETSRRASRNRTRVGASLLAAAVAAGVLASGCVTESAPPPKASKAKPARGAVTTQIYTGATVRDAQSGAPSMSSSGVTPVGGRGKPVGSVNVPPAPETDGCAARLHDISGLLLLYYAIHRNLPEQLDELKPLANPGTEVSFTCPVSHQPYVYVPGGLTVPSNQQRFLVLYDSTPAHGGFHWGITAAPPASGQPLATWITPLTVRVLQAYQASAPPDVPPAQSVPLQQQQQQPSPRAQ